MTLSTPSAAVPASLLVALSLVATACGGGQHRSGADRSARGRLPASSPTSSPASSRTSSPASSPTSPAATTGSPTSAPPTGSAAGGGSCGGQLHLAVQGPTGAAGTIVYTLVLTAGGSAPCTLDGYPQTVLTGTAGQVGPALSPAPGTTPAPVTLRSGQAATATVALDDPGIYACPSATVTGVRVTLAGVGPTLTATLPRSTGACTAASPGASGQVVPGTVTPLAVAG